MKDNVKIINKPRGGWDDDDDENKNENKIFNQGLKLDQKNSNTFFKKQQNSKFKSLILIIFYFIL